MSPEQNKAFIRRYLEAISGKDKTVDLLKEYISEEDAELIEHIGFAERAFPRYEIVPEDMVAEGDKVNVRMRVRGVHKGEFDGIPATGREFDVPGFITYRVADNKIVQHWLLMHNLALMQQLGVVATPETGSR